MESAQPNSDPHPSSTNALQRFVVEGLRSGDLAKANLPAFPGDVQGVVATTEECQARLDAAAARYFEWHNGDRLVMPVPADSGQEYVTICRAPGADDPKPEDEQEAKNRSRMEKLSELLRLMPSFDDSPSPDEE